jgi:prophage maintenance system killer protein
LLIDTVSGAAAPADDFATCHAENNGTKRTAAATMMLTAERCVSTVTTC